VGDVVRLIDRYPVGAGVGTRPSCSNIIKLLVEVVSLGRSEAKGIVTRVH
jgi:hypothetical protein